MGEYSELNAARLQPGNGIDLLAVFAALVDLEMQMWSGGLALGADQCNQLAGSHPLARGHQDLLHVAVDGGIAIRMLDIDGLPESGRRAGAQDYSVTGGIDGCAVRGGQIHAPMEGAPALAEAGRDRSGARPDPPSRNRGSSRPAG